jgi:hypothetical protein
VRAIECECQLKHMLALSLFLRCVSPVAKHTHDNSTARPQYVVILLLRPVAEAATHDAAFIILL